MNTELTTVQSFSDVLQSELEVFNLFHKLNTTSNKVYFAIMALESKLIDNLGPAELDNQQMETKHFKMTGSFSEVSETFWGH